MALAFDVILGNSKAIVTAWNPLFQFELVFKIQSRYAFRASEILSLNSDALHDDFNILIKLAKCDEYIFLRDEEIWKLLFEVFDAIPEKCFSISYIDYYRYVKKAYPEIITRGNRKNFRVTHSFRYAKMKELRKTTNNPKILKALLRHQSINSQKYYFDNKK